MTPSRLGVQALMAVIALVAANAVIHRSAANSVPRQVLRRGQEAPAATDLFLGNSTMMAALDEHVFSKHRPGSRPLNLGLGSSEPVEHYLILLHQERHHGAAIYYGFFGTQLTEPPEGSWFTLVGNRAMAYYGGLETALEFYAPGNPVRAWLLRTVARVPLLVERYAIWSSVEKARRVLGGLGLPKKQANRFGQAEDFALLESGDEALAEAALAAAGRTVSLSSPVMALLGRAREQGGPVYVIEMPVPQARREQLYDRPEWQAYRARVASLVRNAGATFIPATDWVADTGFADPLHVNASGAMTFSARLALWSAEHP